MADQIFHIGTTSAANPVHGITAGGTGSLVQDHVIAKLRGPANSAAIHTTTTGSFLPHNRESDYNAANLAMCTNITSWKATFSRPAII